MNFIIGDDFLLETSYARELYHNYAKPKPIIDFHSHLPADEIAKDRRFDNLTQLWINGDHYKWRAMRNLGIEEKYITGNAGDKEKFDKWAFTVPYTMRNPLYHWTHLELTRYFGIKVSLNPASACIIYDQCNEQLKRPEFGTRGLVKRMNAEILCTTDDPADTLSYHKQIADSGYAVRVFPTFRPDRIIGIEQDSFMDYLNNLSAVSGIDITDFDSMLEAVKSRIAYFHNHGCRLSDHGLSHAYSIDFTEEEVSSIFKSRLNHKPLTAVEVLKYKSAILFYLGVFYAEKDWCMQLHLGPVRNTNKAMLRKIGADVGVDSIGDYPQAEMLASFLNRLNENDALPKTILYNSNPADNEVFATMAGNFCGEGIKGKVQFGPAWWFLDQKDGITKQLNALSNLGLLCTSVGMVTDSRSFLSFPRHEYFRRILCNLFGNDIKNGELPNDLKWIGKIVEDICYNNARDYFKFSVSQVVHKPKNV